MKKLRYTVLLLLIITTTIYAQSPEKMSYQAIIRNANGNLVTSANVGMKISILQGSASGNEVYAETHTVLTNANGLVSVEIASGTVVTGSFSGIDWSNGPYFIKTETDPTGGTAYTISGTTQLMSVPYALHAKTAESLSLPVNETDPLFTTSPSGTITNADITNWNNAFNRAPWDSSWASIKNKPAFSTVAFSGDYNDLSNKPAGNTQGDMQYWNGTSWVLVPAGQPGQYLQFTSLNKPEWTGAAFSMLSTNTPTSVTDSSAVCGGNITNDGGGSITARGVCWSLSPNPTVSLPTKTADGSGSGTFTSNISGLSLGNTYYVRSYAVNGAGTSYGNEIVLNVGIGASSQGGIVAYIFQPGDPGYISGETHGLIAAPMDQSLNAAWGCYGVDITGAYNSAIGTGNQNTTAIVAGCSTAGIAARICDDLVLNGYSDWYLPSIDELMILYNNKNIIGGFDPSVNSFYWSSTQYYNPSFLGDFAYDVDFNSGTISHPSKTYATWNVRAIRLF